MKEMINTIQLGDCYELIKKIPDNSIDLIITDPPYEMETRGAGFHNKRDYYDLIHDKKMANGISENLLKEFDRVMKKTNIYIFCNKNQLPMYLKFYKNKNFDLLVWHKVNPIPTINNKYLSDLEYIVFARDKSVTMYNTYETSSKLFQSVVNKSDKQLYKHPTIKPLEIIKNLIINSSKEDNVILDCFCGSGTTCVAAKELGRRFIGIEIDKEYHKIATDRLNGINANGQTSIFTDFESLEETK
ncbi:site-specific DNA-methyltransferase [uncultured Thomasclavelia sp.]|uniref:DNA-methyltransferase n=1 Tax=uncultured Thomasclavelia sp. TaxID=3025759 RepID=UPI0025927611|nr:site-specific DNA-methyltransferase [uncultured Thomasclavelia sp.]